MPDKRGSQPTIAHAIPPVPESHRTPPEIEKRASQPMIAHAIPPLPESHRTPTEIDNITTVEIDAEAKARAEAKADAARQRSTSEMRTGPRELAINEPTEINVQIPMPPDTGSDQSDDRETQPLKTTGEMGAVTDQMAAQPGITTAELAAQPGATDEMPAQQAPRRPSTEPLIPAQHPLPRPSQQLLPTGAPRPSANSISTAPSSLPPPRMTESIPSGPTPACPQCESPMSWVEEHLRFYCKECRMYF